ncbi:flagellar export chaperone FliS [Paenibacillus lautus]|uniref:flagellar export chaperone FliS n=1 Tax=Paenibacillus lautus TaxID=1401 RepID=UPI001C11AA41|nr:flagellar export chaperone FliS [Paenibacillus lautus]MBU5349292.1 flagellar export chaperone FliS [Paenibacillus lautus]
MMMQNYQLQYQKVRVETASPGELTLILYEELYRRLNLSRHQFEGGNIEESKQNVQRSRDILQELLVTLNMEYEISQQLYQLYDYYLRRLNDFIIHKSIEILEEVIEFSKDMVGTWKQALQIVKSGNDQ